jgi:transcriptional regulator GlxA family with amidase domain
MRCTKILLLALGCLTVAPTLLAAPDEENSATPEPSVKSTPKQRTLGILIYDRFELLDACGPAEVFGSLGGTMKVVMIAEKAGPVKSTQGVHMVADYGFEDCPPLDLILVAGGIGTMKELKNDKLLGWLKERAPAAELVMSVCSGSALLAKAGLLDGRKATCNKMYFRMLTGAHKGVDWVVEARWVEDDKFITSSGVSAGMDMALGVVRRLYDEKRAEGIANGIEYEWHRDSTWDPFAKVVKK